MEANSRTLFRLRSNESASLRLVWVPYAGGSAAAFQNLSNRLPSTIEPFAIEYPGRGRRRAEPLKTDLMLLAQEVAAACMALTDKPYAIFGHSMGALVAFEACRLLQLGRAQPPRLLIASAHAPPHLPSDSPKLHALPADELTRALKKLGGTPGELVDHKELMELALPVLRADFTACEMHRFNVAPKLALNLAAYGGTDDQDVAVEKLDRWSDLITGSASSRIFHGGHFYVHDDIAALILAVTADLEVQAT